MLRVGLTGGIAAGKSTVAGRLRENGVPVIDYDELARLVVAPGSEGMHRIRAAFGDRAVAADGGLDRAWMAAHVFGGHAEPGARERLDAIEHPLIYAEAERRERELSDQPIVVHDIPLLVEVLGTMPMRFDRIVTVEAPERVRVERMVTGRGMTAEQARARIGSQSSRAEREAIADDVIDATRPIEQMFEYVDRLVEHWREASAVA